MAGLETQKEGRGPTPEGERKEVYGKMDKVGFRTERSERKCGLLRRANQSDDGNIFFLASPEEIHCQIVEGRAKQHKYCSRSFRGSVQKVSTKCTKGVKR